MSRLSGRDYFLLALYGAVLFSFPLLFNRPLSTHETIHCVNIREMRSDGDLIIPHFGGRPWLERPPLPFWLTLPVIALVGDIPAAYRLAPALIAIPCVLLVAWMASVWFGRGVGILAGLILATMREFTHYATAPECDMFLCGVVTTALALFVHLEFQCRPAESERGFVWGRRPWPVLAFFVVLGLGNLVKGLFFGDLMILLPVAAYLLAGSRPWESLRRYFWLPGWLAFLAVASSWALAAYLRYPDIVDLWKSDYAGRVHQGYMREPIWYYFVHLPWNLFPWTVAALLGLALTRGRVVGHGRTAERFLWLWALVPVLFFTIPQGKHHHYLLHIMAPWAVLAALGTVRLWEWLPRLTWLRTPWPILLGAALPGEAALAVFLPRAALPGWLIPTALLLWPATLLACWWVLGQPDLRRAGVGIFALLPLALWGSHASPALLNDRYTADLAFIQAARAEIPAGSPLLVLDAWGPLDPSWLVFYFDGRADLLHNLTFLRDGRIAGREVYLVARPYQVTDLSRYGQAQILLASKRSRDERSPDYRYTLYRVRLHDDLVRHAAPVYISPMQATGRAPGPELR